MGWGKGSSACFSALRSSLRRAEMKPCLPLLLARVPVRTASPTHPRDPGSNFTASAGLSAVLSTAEGSSPVFVIYCQPSSSLCSLTPRKGPRLQAEVKHVRGGVGDKKPEPQCLSCRVSLGCPEDGGAHSGIKESGLCLAAQSKSELKFDPAE